MIQLEVWGDYALFARGELKVERVSYDVPTPSAARGIVESIYYHPGLRWRIRRVYVMNPIRFVNIRRNEVKGKILASDLLSAARSGGEPCLVSSQQIVQRAAMVLRDVHYVIEAEFEMTNRAAPGDNPGKFQDIVTRRMAKGQAYSTPYFGCREFPVSFRPWSGGPVPTIGESRDLGFMLYDFDYSDPQNIQPTYFRARLENGVLDLTDCEVYR